MPILGEAGDRVSITNLGNDTLVTVIDDGSILLEGVNGNGANVITIDDFHLLS